MAGKSNLLVVSGKRKTSVAKAKIRAGSGNVLYNGLPYQELRMFHKLALSEPIKITEDFLKSFKFDIEVKTQGGGKESQIQAARLAIAKALVKFTKNADLKKAFLDYDRHLLVADTRRKEQYKPDDSKARAKRQSSKR
jgi:small subunit ribosomal protein S9